MMKTVILAIVRVLTALVMLTCLGFTIYFAVTQVWIGVVSCAALTAGFGYFTYRDIRALLAKRTS